MGRCRVPDCSGITEYDESAQSVLCTSCGTVVTQNILTHEWDAELCGSLYFGPTTLKSLRRVGGVLAGQSSKEDRDRRNSTAMQQYILGLLTKLACSGFSARAHTLFNEARTRGRYRWGKKAVLVAGGCIVVVLREGKKGITISQLASIMDVSPHALCRTFTEICRLLHLQVPPFNPLSLLPHLQTHLITLTGSSTSTLPEALIKMLQILPLGPVIHLASSLAILLDQLGEFSSLGPSASPTACALFIIALEGQAASSLPSYTTLARELGAKVGARKDLVISRYRDISKVLGEWMKDVPWLCGPDHPDNLLKKNRRKSSQRDVIAMAVRDVVQFRQDIQLARKVREMESPVTVSLVVEEHDDSGGDTLEPVLGRKRRCSQEPDTFQPSGALRLIRPRKVKSSISQMDFASLSLLSPSHPFSQGFHVSHSQEECQKIDETQNRILTSPTFPIESASHTRLQRLVVSRGGETYIDDDELFGKGEMEGFLRNDEEITRLRGLFGWDKDQSIEDTDSAVPSSSSLSFDGVSAEMAIWEDVGHGIDNDCQSGEEILGLWREISPSRGTVIEGDDDIEPLEEW